MTLRTFDLAVPVAVAAAGGTREVVRVAVDLVRLAVDLVRLARLAVGPLAGELLLEPLLVLVMAHPVQAVVVQRILQAIVGVGRAVGHEHADRLDHVVLLSRIQSGHERVEGRCSVRVRKVGLAEDRSTALVSERLEIALDLLLDLRFVELHTVCGSTTSVLTTVSVTTVVVSPVASAQEGLSWAHGGPEDVRARATPAPATTSVAPKTVTRWRGVRNMRDEFMQPSIGEWAAPEYRFPAISGHARGTADGHQAGVPGEAGRPTCCGPRSEAACRAHLGGDHHEHYDRHRYPVHEEDDERMATEVREQEGDHQEPARSRCQDPPHEGPRQAGR